MLSKPAGLVNHASALSLELLTNRPRIFAAAHFADFARNSRQLPACLAARDLEFDHANVIRFLRTTESRVEFAFRGCGSTFTAAHKFANPSVVPLCDDIETSGANLSHRAVTIVVENNDYRIKPEANYRREFGAGHLEGAIAHQDIGA